MITQDLGIATAYGYAKSKGYTGTEAEFAELMASYASTAQTAIEAADRAVEANTAAQSAKTDAAASKTAAQTAAQTATTKASEASQSASTATTKASEASQSASTASTAATSAGTSAQTATTAASTATTKASEAVVSATTASTAKTDAESARDAAARSASEAAASAASIDPETLEHKAYGAYVVESASGAIASFDDGADSIPMKDVLVHIEPVQEGSGDPSPDNVRPITGWTGCVISHSGADTSNPTTYPITFPSETGTVYGGTLDVTSGVLTVDRAMRTLDGETVWVYYQTTGNNTFNAVVSNMDTAKAGVSSMYPFYKVSYISEQPDKTFYFFDNRISVRNDSYTDAASFGASVNGMQLVYPLATPITYTLTPQEITSLLGANNVWADTGDVSVEYRADTRLYIEKLTQPEENDMIADSAISEGRFFMVGNSLYRALANIASGATITVGTNAQRVSLSDALNLVNA